MAFLLTPPFMLINSKTSGSSSAKSIPIRFIALARPLSISDPECPPMSTLIVISWKDSFFLGIKIYEYVCVQLFCIQPYDSVHAGFLGACYHALQFRMAQRVVGGYGHHVCNCYSIVRTERRPDC